MSEKPSAILIPLILAVSMLTVTGFSVAGLSLLRIIDYNKAISQAGLIRGGLQRMVKLELAGIQTESDRLTIDEFILRLRSGPTRFDTRKFDALDASIQNLHDTVLAWRNGQTENDRIRLIQDSESLWQLTNDIAFDFTASSTLSRQTFIWGIIISGLGVMLSGFAVYVSKFLIQDKVEVEASFDTMTGALRRDRFLDRLEAFILAKGKNEYIGVVMMDLDHFKRINDGYGHDAGDRVLAAVSGALKSLLRSDDAFGRLGGEEFAVAIRSKDPRAARLFAERARAAVESLRLERLPIMTVSAGVVLTRINEKPLEVLKRADSFLYAAKAAGRNRVRSE
ncbi:MAG: GGDEF domain-containing protein [Spirochaetia bacterium]|nr:GGDEF domain-containing protein [Spirochaetia bacterium]